MIIAIDWDNTITADPVLFESFVEMVLERGHTAVIVTGRQATDAIVPPWPIEVVYAGNEWKIDAAKSAGYDVDIWIDDQPGHIEPCRKLVW